MSLDKKNFPLREPEYAEAPPEYSQSSTAGPSFPSAPPLEATYDENSFSTIQQQGLGSASKLTNNSTNYDGYQLPTLAAPQQQGNFYQQHQQQQQPPSQQQSVRQYGVAPGLRTGGFGGGSKDIIVEMVPLNNNEYTPPTEDACIAALIG